MGIVKPPWISQEFFENVPFNYCDHFGDKEKLALVCKVCREEIEFNKRCVAEGKDPNNPKVAFKEVAKNLKKTLEMVSKMAKEKGIDLNNLPDLEEKEPKYSRYKVYNLSEEYGSGVEELIKFLAILRDYKYKELLLKTYDALSHSRYYVIVKIKRALHSRFEERKDKEMRVEPDSKTSAMLAYLAVDRNSRMMLRLIQHLSLNHARKLEKFSLVSIKLTELIRREFFPEFEGEFEEFGAEEYF